VTAAAGGVRTSRGTGGADGIAHVHIAHVHIAHVHEVAHQHNPQARNAYAAVGRLV
jgi:hypothetical protein